MKTLLVYISLKIYIPIQKRSKQIAIDITTKLSNNWFLIHWEADLADLLEVAIWSYGPFGTILIFKQQNRISQLRKNWLGNLEYFQVNPSNNGELLWEKFWTGMLVLTLRIIRKFSRSIALTHLFYVIPSTAGLIVKNIWLQIRLNIWYMHSRALPYFGKQCFHTLTFQRHVKETIYDF